MATEVRPIEWREGALFLLDQRKLPHEVTHVECRNAGEVAEAIRTMVVRGAPAIGVSAAFGMALAAADSTEEGRMLEAADLLRNARPTAVNLGWAVDRMLECWRELRGQESARIRGRLEREAESIMEEDISANRSIGRFGAELLGQRATILTHCNAGALATAGYGTALGVVRAAKESGRAIRVLADETRPFLQGTRLTAWELQQEGIDVTLITDNMAGYFFYRKEIDAVIVGADRIAANGDTANKIGTYTVAVLAHAHDVPFYVAAPVSTIDRRCADGGSIPIEERDHDEVLHAVGRDSEGVTREVRLGSEGLDARHPAFDVTPAGLITAIITDRGVVRAPYESSISGLFA